MIQSGLTQSSLRTLWSMNMFERRVAFILCLHFYRDMTSSRLCLPGSTPVQCRIPIGFLFAQYMKRRFRKMSSHRSDRLAMVPSVADPSVKSAHVALGPSRVVDRHGIGGLSKAPLGIAVDIRPKATVSDFAPVRIGPARNFLRGAAEILRKGNT